MNSVALSISKYRVENDGRKTCDLILKNGSLHGKMVAIGDKAGWNPQ